MAEKPRNTDPSSDPTDKASETPSTPGRGSHPLSRLMGKKPQPVESSDLGDPDDDIPTYNGPRADAPQATQAPQTTAFARPGEGYQASTSDRLASDAPTTVTPPPPAQPTRQLDREPVPGASYSDTDFAQPVAPAVIPPAQPPEEPVIAEPATALDARRGTLDFGLFIIRVAVGLYLILRGVSAFFAIGGSDGLAGLEAEYAGYQWPEVLAILLPSLELAAGVFLLLGLMTPVAAAVATVATSFTALHQINVHDGGWGELDEAIVLAVVLTLVVIGLQFTGPGRISLDAGRSWARRPLVSSWIFVIIGIALAVVLWWFGAGVNPFGALA